MKRSVTSLCIAGLLAAWGGTGLAQVEPPVLPEPPETNALDEAVNGTTNAAANADFIAVTTLIGQRLQNAAGEDVGQIQEAIVDRRTGKLAHVVVSIGTFLGGADRNYVVPWKAVTCSRLGQFNLNLDREVLRNAPALEAGYTEQTLMDETYLNTVYDYYGYPRPERNEQPMQF